MKALKLRMFEIKKKELENEFTLVLNTLKNFNNLQDSIQVLQQQKLKMKSQLDEQIEQMHKQKKKKC